MKIFKEEQRFTQLWLHILLVVSFIVPIVLVVNEYVKREHKDTEASLGLIVVMISILLVYGLIFSLKLKTKIDELGIHFRFVPFHFKKRTISWSAVEKAYIRNYEPISEYGGWGMKGGKLWNKDKGLAYNVKGDIGLQLELKSGKKILIGTQKQEEMKRVLQTYSSKFVNSIE